MNVEIGTVAACAVPFLEIFVSNFRYCIFAVYHSCCMYCSTASAAAAAAVNATADTAFVKTWIVCGGPIIAATAAAFTVLLLCCCC